MPCFASSADVQSELNDQFPAHMTKIHDYVDKKVETINHHSFPDTLAKLGKVVDDKFLLNISKTEGMIEKRVQQLPGLNDIRSICDNAIKQCVNNKIIPKYSDLGSLNQMFSTLNKQS